MITSVDELVAALGRAQSLPVRKAFGAGVPFGVTSLWREPGMPGEGELPVDLDGAFPTAGTQGALRFQSPLGAEVSQLARLAASASEPCQLVIYDRIWHGRIDVSTTAVQDVTWPAGGQRYSHGEGCELWAEIGEPLGSAVPATWTAEILDQDGEPTELDGTFDGDGSRGRMIHMAPVESLGVQRVLSVQLSQSQPSGELFLVLMRRLVEIPLSAAGVAVAAAGLDLGLPVVEREACLALAIEHGAETGPDRHVFARLDLVQG